jgi:catechol 2,3-dioxygenase-like lactoylglutathione lyase family enzyme
VIQIGIVVRDLDAKVEAWSAFLGTAPTWTGETGPVEETHATYMGDLTPARCRQAIFDLGQCSLELIEPIGQPSTWTDFLEDRGEGLHHVAFRVDGMAEGIGRLQEAGNPLVQSGEFPNGRYAYLDAAETLATVVELLEHDAPVGRR